jgi:NTE family protein
MPVTLEADMVGKASSNAEAQYAAAPGRRKVALALQGGGSHGAFTWGVLDRLLDDETIEIIGVTGTSAGGMNGALLVDGLVRGGPKQARTELRRYWEAVGSMPGFGSYFSNMSGEQAVTTPLENIPAYVETMKKNSSPYDLPSANDHPTRRLLTELDRFRSLAFTAGHSAHRKRNQRPHCKTARFHQSGHLGRCSAGFSLLAAVLSRRGD